MRKHENAAVDVGASAAARQSRTFLCCAFPLRRPALSNSTPEDLTCQSPRPFFTLDFYGGGERGGGTA